MKKTLILLAALVSCINPCLADNLAPVSISQPRTQTLDANTAAANKNCKDGNNGSGMGSGMGSASPCITRNLVNGNPLYGRHNSGNGGAGFFGAKNSAFNHGSTSGSDSGAGSGSGSSPYASNQAHGSGNNNGQNSNSSSSSSGTYGGSSSGHSGSSKSGFGPATASPATTMQAFVDNFPETRSAADSSFGGMMIHATGAGGTGGRLVNPTSTFMKAPIGWPNVVPGGPTQLPTTSVAAANNIPAAIRNDGSGPVTATQMAAIASAAASFAAMAPMMPDARLQSTKEELNAVTQQQADNSGDMEKQQAGSAIAYVRTAMENFTVDPGNQWNKLRDQLFMPIAVLLLLPGVVATQAKATISQTIPIFGDSTSPFEGLYRSVVAIFLIPGTYLIVNYGIDVSNSIAETIQQRYYEIFGTDMYRDATCGHVRAFGTRLPNENMGFIPNQVSQMAQNSKSPRGKFEQGNVDVKLEDPCAGIYNAPADKANEKVPYAVNAQRAAYNGAGAALAMTWNILCAFQMCYLYYLWFVGPIMAALWVYPVTQLRSAFPNWCEGVITICFWSLFWHTVVVLMACFRGIDDTGTVIMEALNFLSTACVKFAFDFGSLVRAAGAQAGKMAEKAGSSAASGGGGGKSSGGSSGGRASSSAGKAGSSSPTAASSAATSSSNGSSAGKLGTPVAASTSHKGDNHNSNRAGSEVNRTAGTAMPIASSTDTGSGSTTNLFDTGSPSTSMPPTSAAINPSLAVPGVGSVSPKNEAGIPGSNTKEQSLKQGLQEEEQNRFQQTQRQQEEQREKQQKQQTEQAANEQRANMLAQTTAQNNHFDTHAFNSHTSSAQDPGSAKGSSTAFAPSGFAVSDKSVQIDSKNSGANQFVPGQTGSFSSTAWSTTPSASPVGSVPGNQTDAPTLYRSNIDTTGSNVGSQSFAPLSKMYYDSSESMARVSINSAEVNSMMNAAIPVPEASSFKNSEMYRLTGDIAVPSSIGPSNTEPKIVDLPATTSTTQLDAGVSSSTAAANTSFSRASFEDGNTFSSTCTTSFATSETSTTPTVASSSASAMVERTSAAVDANVVLPVAYATQPEFNTAAPAQQGETIYRQQQHKKVEEMQRVQAPAERPQASKLNVTLIPAQMDKQNKLAAHMQSIAKSKTGETQAPPATQQASRETEALANKSLAEIIRYENIRNKQRTVGQMSAEELELMAKLGQEQVTQHQ